MRVRYKHTLFLFLIFHVIISFVKAQGEIDIDSLEKVVPYVKDAEKVRVLINLSRYYESIDPEKTIYYSKLSLKTQNKLGIFESKSVAFNLIGNGYRATGNNVEALNFYQKALSASTRYGNKKEEARSINNIGIIYRLFGDYSKSLELHMQALSIFRDIRHKQGIAQSLNKCGVAYKNLGHNTKAVDCYNQALILSKQTGDNYEEAYSLLNIGNVYWSSNMYNLAMDYYQKSLVIYKKRKDYKEVASLINNIGNVYRDRGNINEALKRFFTSLDISIENKDYNQVAVTYKNIGKTFFLINMLDTALYYYNRSLNIASENYLLRFVQEDYLLISETYAKKGDKDKTITYLKLYNQIREKILSEERSQNISELQYKFQIDRKEKEIRDIRYHKNQLILNVIFIISLILASIAILLYNLYTNKRRNALLLSKEIKERKITEKLLTESEEKFRNLADMLPEAIYETNENGIFTYVNNTWFDLFGYSEPEIRKGMQVFEMIAAEDKIRAIRNRQNSIIENKSIRHEYQAVKKDGTIFPVIIHINPISINGKDYGTRGIVIDITSQKNQEKDQAILLDNMKSLNLELIRSQKELKEALELTLNLNEKIKNSEANMKAIFDGTSQMLIFINKEYKIISFNKAASDTARAILKNHLKEFTSILDYIPHRYLGIFDDDIKKAFSGEIINIERPFSEKGHEMWFNLIYNPVYDNSHNIIGVLVSISDISLRKKTELALIESEHKFRSLVELAADGIFLSNPEGNFIEVNSSACKITGYLKEELLSMNMTKLFSEKGLVEKPLQVDLLLKGEAISTEIELQRKDGTFVPIEMNTIRTSEGIFQAFIRDVSERKKAEAALIESRRTLSTIIDNTPGLVYRCKNDRDWTMEVISENCYTITGYRPVDFISRSISYNDIIYPEDREPVFQGVQLGVENNRPYRLTYRIITAKGDLRWVWEQGCGIFNTNGELMALEGLIIDITEQKISEELLHKNEQRLQLALEAANEGLWDFNVEKNEMDFLSPRFFTILGYEPYEFKVNYEKMIDLIHPDDTEKFKKHLRNFIRKKTKSLQIEFRMKSKNGNYIWIFSRGKAVSWDNKGNILRMVGTHVDVSDRKQYEANLIENELKFRAAFENVNYGKIIVGLDKKFIKMNRAFHEMLNYTEEELIGKSFDDVTHADDIDKSGGLLREMIRGTKSYVQFQKRYIKKYGSVVYVNLDISLIRNTGGEPLYFITHVQDITERKHAAEALMRSEEKYRQLAEQTSDIIWTMDLKMNLTYINPAIKKHLGYSVEEYLLLSPGQKFPPNALKTTTDVVETELMKINNGLIPGKNYFIVYELEHYHKNGSIMWGEVNFTFILNSENKIAGIQGTTRNISERKRIEESMRKSEERLKFALDAANDGLWDFNPHTRVVNYFSPRWYTLLGFEPYEFPMEHSRWVDLILEQDKNAVMERLNDYMRGVIDNYSIEFRMKTKDGKYKWILSRGKIMQVDEAGNITRIVGTHSDISERKEAEEALIASRQKYMELTEFLPQSVFEIDNKGNLLFANRYAFQSFGFDATDFKKGINVFNLLSPEYREKASINIARIMKGESLSQSEYLMIRKDGTSFHAIVNSNPVYSGNEIIGLRGLIIDISEQKNVQYQLKAAKEKAEESDRLKSAFLANMSHEIRTPMNAILGFTELLKTSDLTEEKKNNFIDIINKRGKDLLNIINDIIDISKIESKQMKINYTRCFLNTVMQELFVFFENDISLQEKKKLKLRLKTISQEDSSGQGKEQIGFVMIDDMRLKQIFMNLLSNAVKFTTTGSIEFGYTIEGDMLCFFVKDTGMGIPKDKLSVIFDRFRQADDSTSRNYGGTGLGLAISKNLVEMMNGTINVESEIGKGSKFTFRLPFVPVNEIVKSEKEKAIPEQKYHWNDKTIMIVEDDKVNFLYLSTLLKKTKVKIIHAQNGMEAVETCKANPEINLILMDIQMPEMNGYDATKIIKKNRPGIPVIAQTAYAMEEDRVKCMQAGCDDFIVKPIKIDTLISTVDKYL